MRKFLILSALVLLPVLACAQARVDSPVTVEWEGEATKTEVAIQALGQEIIIIGETAAFEYYIDLQDLGYYGLFAILVRSVEFTEPDMYDYSEWARSDIEEDVIIIDGVAATFLVESKRPAIKPTMLRIK